ncbi:MAG: InlB B-repeat-containing protein [Clostridia bacterium]|nr:InlB B-repeat-containing protein [Clostridia bacterium]
MKKKVLCTAMAVTILLIQTASAAPWQMRRNQLMFDSEMEFLGNVTLTFALDGGSFIRPIIKRYGEIINLERYIPTKYGYTFKGWFTDPRTKQNQVATFKFTKPDVLYAKWERNENKIINLDDKIMAKDTCYLTDEEIAKRNKIIEEKNKNYIDGFGYVAPSKTQAIIVDSDGDINKMVGTME